MESHSKDTLFTAASILSAMPLLEGTFLQVTHNRLLGSGGRDQHSWLHAFNWSLFYDPLIVWNACEVNELATARRLSDREWLISFNSDSRSGTLNASDIVPSMIRHIWGLPLATSEGFGDASASSFDRPLSEMRP